MSLLDDLKLKFSQDNAIIKIIYINVAVFLIFAIAYVISLLFNATDWIGSTQKWLMLPASLTNFIFKPWTLVSYMFLHDGVFHILFNMLWLYWMGQILQQFLGNIKTYQAYFLGGIAGGLFYMLCYNVFPVFESSLANSHAIGASAGVLSVVVATATLLPDYQMILLFFGAVRLKYIALVSVLLDLISIPQGNAGGHLAHLGGAAFGFIFIKFIYSKSSAPTYLDKIFEIIFNAFKPKPKLKVRYKTTYMKVENSNKPTQEEVDNILDKISKSGYNSLTPKEKETLFKASK